MTPTGIVTAIVFGLIIGVLARLVIPGKQSIPIWLTIIVGIIGAFVGTFIAQALDFKTEGFNFVELILQVVVAVVGVLLVAGLYSRRGART